MLSKKLQEEIRRQASPSPPTWLWHRNRSCPFRRQLPNDINRKCRPQTFAHARHARPRPLDPHPSLVLFVSSSPSSSQRLGPAPSLSDLTATVCMHARVFTVQAPPLLSLPSLSFPTYMYQGHTVKGAAASFTLVALRVHTLVYFIVAAVSMPALT